MLVVGTWAIEEPLLLAQMLSPEKYLDRFVNDLKDLKEQALTLDFLRQENEKMRKQINNEELYKILEFFSEEFAKTDTIDHNEYKLANYYKDRVLNKTQQFPDNSNIDGIWYPSVSSGYKNINIVFPPENIRGKLRFLWADLIWVVYFKDQRIIQFIPIENRAKIDEAGVIQWNTKTITDILSKSKNMVEKPLAYLSLG
ncbi:MAG: hypothetical protein Q8M08_13905 [Bacteroidales bacterium]|nr:hypothetical protein [Bacteroidales bacterium]